VGNAIKSQDLPDWLAVYAVKGLFEIDGVNCKGLRNSLHCSRIFRRVKICSLQDLPLRKTACSFRRERSISDFMRFRITVQNILPRTDSRVIPLQLLQSLRHPFFGNGRMIPYLHSLGTFSSCQMVLMSMYYFHVSRVLLKCYLGQVTYCSFVSW